MQSSNNNFDSSLKNDVPDDEKNHETNLDCKNNTTTPAICEKIIDPIDTVVSDIISEIINKISAEPNNNIKSEELPISIIVPIPIQKHTESIISEKVLSNTDVFSSSSSTFCCQTDKQLVPSPVSNVNSINNVALVKAPWNGADLEKKLCDNAVLLSEWSNMLDKNGMNESYMQIHTYIYVC